MAGAMGSLEPWQETLFEGYDPMDWNTRFAFVGLGALFWTALYFSASIISQVVSKTHNTLTPKDKMFWNLCIVRAVFGIVYSILGSYCAFFVYQFGPNIVNQASPFAKFSVMVAVSFFIFECLALAVFDVAFKTFDIALAMHHLISLQGFTMCTLTDSFHYFALAGALLEASTPFTGYSWIMWKCGYEQTWGWRKNQWMMVHAFHGRSFIECFLWIQSYRHWTNIWSDASWAMLFAFYPGLVLMTVFLTPTWLSKKTDQLTKSKQGTPKQVKFQQMHAETQMAFGLRPYFPEMDKETVEAKKKRLKTI